MKGIDDILSVIDVDFNNKSKRRDLSIKRQVFWLILSKRGYTNSEIAIISGRSRPTVISGIKTVQGLIDIKSHELDTYRETIDYFVPTEKQEK